MKEYDVIVIGSGSGGEIVESALNHGNRVAWIDKGPLGGTCLNNGCIPSKMLIYPADRVMDIKEAEDLGIKATIEEIEFNKIMKHMKEPIIDSQKHMRDGLNYPIENFDYYEGLGYFIDNYSIEINNIKIRGKKIFIGTGARPDIPKIKGINQIDYLTNENVFDIKTCPKRLIIIGGGYISVEFAHFFSSMGSEVTVLQRNDRLIKNSEPEISELLKNQMEKRIKILTNVNIVEVINGKNKLNVIYNQFNSNAKTIESEKIFIATGRKSNADLLKIENTDIKVDQRNFIKVNKYLETSVKNIWAFGDAIGKFMFKHVANEEAVTCWHNSLGNHKTSMDYSAIPYAVFSHPQIASVGLTENEAKSKYEILVGKARYSDVAKGEAMMEIHGFTKAIVDKKTRKILGFHIIGPYAPILIQEVINAMALGGEIGYLGRGMHIHPALSELILSTFSKLREVS
ncbi:dihydrolipoyl dehydrogenase [Thermoplasmatota archaeon]